MVVERHGDEAAFQAALAQLDRHTAILAANDQLAARVIESARASGRDVPEDLAVMGVDNDDLVCESCEVAITSVDTVGHRVGEAAGELLHRLLRGELPPEGDTLVPVKAIVSRRSTEAVPIDDAQLKYAMELIRIHACDPMNVDGLVQRSGIPRRTLEKRFRLLLGRSPHDEIHRAAFCLM